MDDFALIYVYPWFDPVNKHKGIHLVRMSTVSSVRRAPYTRESTKPPIAAAAAAAAVAGAMHGSGSQRENVGEVSRTEHDITEIRMARQRDSAEVATALSAAWYSARHNTGTVLLVNGVNMPFEQTPRMLWKITDIWWPMHYNGRICA